MEKIESGWRKSLRSMANGNCVEIKPVWVKSRRSMTNGACVEVAAVARP